MQCSSINICFNFYTGKSSLIAMNICSMTPIHVKHLEVSIKDLVEAATVLYRLQLLSSVKFIFDYSPVWKPFIAWLEKQKKCSIYHMNIYFHRKTKSNSITSKKWYRIVKRKRPTWHSNNAYKKKEQKIHKNRVQLLAAVSSTVHIWAAKSIRIDLIFCTTAHVITYLKQTEYFIFPRTHLKI
jgi:hypothetical protein